MLGEAALRGGLRRHVPLSGAGGRTSSTTPAAALAKASAHYDLVIVGSGPAAQKCAIESAKYGKSVCIVDKSSQIGGVCVHTGTIPSKTFRWGGWWRYSAALLLHVACLVGVFQSVSDLCGLDKPPTTWVSCVFACARERESWSSSEKERLWDMLRDGCLCRVQQHVHRRAFSLTDCLHPPHLAASRRATGAAAAAAVTRGEVN